MRHRRRLQRRLFYLALRRMKENAPPDEMALLETASADRDVAEIAYEQAMRNAAESSTRDFSVTRSADGEPLVDNLLKLFDWFLNNGPEIIELIKLIVGLFGGFESSTSQLQQAYSCCETGPCCRGCDI